MKRAVFFAAIFAATSLLLPSQSFADNCIYVDSAETFHKKGNAFLRITPRGDLDTFHLESFDKIDIWVDEKRRPCIYIIGNYLKVYAPTQHSVRDWEIAIRKALEGAYNERMKDNSPYRSYPVPQYRGELND